MFEKLLTVLQRQCLTLHPLEAHLYPALKETVLFRLYRPEDRDTCINIHRRLEPGRFPVESNGLFEKYLNDDEKTFIIAELDGKIVGCGGIGLNGPQVATLCFGFVVPEMQGKRIGTTLTLLRLAQLPPLASGYHIFIFAVEKSIQFYKRFGFVESGHWAPAPNVKCPIGILSLPNLVLTRIKRVLQRRRIKVAESITAIASTEFTCRVEPHSPGMVQFKWEKKTDSESGAKIES